MKFPTARRLPSGAWFCRVRANGRDIPITRATKKEAVAEAMAVKTGIKDAVKRPDAITLTDAIDRYIQSRSNILSPATIRGYRIIQDNRFRQLMLLRADKIDRKLLQAAVNEESGRYCEKTIRNSLGLILTVLRDCGVELDPNSISTPLRVEKEKQIYTEQELRTLLSAVRGSDIEIPILLALWLGMRRSEILGLKWEDVDFTGKTVYIHAAMVQNEKNEYVEKCTKTAGSTRRLPCPDYILDVLRSVPRSGSHVVTMSPQTIRNHMVSVTQKSGIPFIGLHALRHTNASVMLSLNIADKYAMERGGWTSNDTMKRIYQHTMDDAKQSANQAVDRYFSALSAAPPRPKRFKLIRLPKPPSSPSIKNGNENGNAT